MDDAYYKNFKIIGGYVSPPFYEPQFNAIKRFLDNPQSELILGETSKANPKSFYYEKVHQVRGTQYIYIQYSGSNTNVLLTVVSNAACMVVTFYKTNFPQLKAEYFGDSLINNE